MTPPFFYRKEPKKAVPRRCSVDKKDVARYNHTDDICCRLDGRPGGNISRTGSYLSETCGIQEGEAIAYLIAPPLEAMYGVDAALKAADVRLCVLYAPPSETNFGGGLLTGSQSACKSACDAFAAAVEFVADNPID